MKQYSALYERISGRDGDSFYSPSIARQKEILEHFANQNGYTPFRHFEDRGVSGKHFRRRGFRSMLSEIEAGNVSTVIVVELSRFGRNYQECAYYTEDLFPRLGVRFLSVEDGIDTFQDWENEFLPFLNLVHDWYSRECSRKRRQIAKLKTAHGKRHSSRPIYGYLPDPANWDHRIPDPETAPVVRSIFRQFLQGRTTGEIARDLSQNGVPTPRDQYLMREDPAFIPSNSWTSTAIRKLLFNDEYMGVKVLHTHATPSGNRRFFPEEEIIRIPHLHFAAVNGRICETYRTNCRTQRTKGKTEQTDS